MTRDVPAGDNEDLRWVANSATLIYADQEAVLVDTFMTIRENERLVDWVKAHGRDLTHIFLTHGHGDHVYGVGQLLEAFPGAQAVATTGTVPTASASAIRRSAPRSARTCSVSTPSHPAMGRRAVPVIIGRSILGALGKTAGGAAWLPLRSLRSGHVRRTAAGRLAAAPARSRAAPRQGQGRCTART